jgi:hypothetical protein
MNEMRAFWTAIQALKPDSPVHKRRKARLILLKIGAFGRAADARNAARSHLAHHEGVRLGVATCGDLYVSNR